MKKKVYRYSVIQFVPSRERQESVNIGVVAISPKEGKFYYQVPNVDKKARVLLPPNVDISVYHTVREAIKQRFQSIQQMAKQEHPNEKLTLETFHDVIRPRESMIQYSAPGVIVGDSGTQVQEELVKRFV